MYGAILGDIIGSPYEFDAGEKTKEFPKIIYSCLLIMQNFQLCGLQQTVENCSRDGNTILPYLPPEKSVYRLGSIS